MRSLRSVRPTLGVFVILLVLAAIAVSPPPALAAPNVTGQWSTLPYLVPVNPIHVALLPNGKVLIVAGSESNPPEAGGPYKYAVWDPAAGTFNNYTTPWDLFCNGMSYLPDGRLILTGGTPLYARAELSRAGLPASVATDALWWPPAKIVGRYLAPFLAERSGAILDPPGQFEGISVEADLSSLATAK